MTDIAILHHNLAQIFGPSGQEGAVAEAISALARPHADEVRTDCLGNLFAYKKGSGGKKVLFFAHMDTVGVIVTHICKEGFLWFSPIGELTAATLLGATVRFENGTRGVVAAGGKADIKNIKFSDLYIDIGASSETVARQCVAVGDPAVFDTPAIRLGGDCLLSPALSGRMGCAVLLAAMEGLKAPENDLYFVFSVQEEVKSRGIKTAAYAIEPDIAFAVDVTDAGDTPDFSPKRECRLHGGAAVKLMDSSIICHPKAVRWLEEAAVRENIPYQRDITAAGFSGAGAVHTARSGVISGAVSVPARYLLSPAELCALSDAEACVRLVRAACGVSL